MQIRPRRPNPSCVLPSTSSQLARALALALLPLVAAAAPPPASLAANPEFDEAFHAYYEALAAYAPEDLKLELSDTIEDALTSGGHLARTSLDYKVRQIERALMDGLRGELCTPSAPGSSELNALKLVAIERTAGAAEQSTVRFEPEEFGMITGVVVRLVQRTPRAELCGSG